MDDLFPNLDAFSFTPTRAAGLQRMEAFQSKMGSHYAGKRNHDLGPGDRSNVSALSPWVRHRVLLEEDLARAAVDRFALSTAEKFVQEVCWRTYFKGWLEHRPGVWNDYVAERDRQYERLAHNAGLRSAWEEAIEGRTGIEGFDDWARELIDTGYLHNHARMWFASIWIFTLGLPWELGDREDIMVVTVYYQWTLITPLISKSMANMPNDVRLLVSTQAFRNEPF